MKLRASSIGLITLYAVLLTGVATLVFTLTNMGIDPRANRDGPIDPIAAPSGTWTLIGIYLFAAIIFFDEYAPDTDLEHTTGSDPRGPRRSGSFTGFVREPLLKVLTVGPLFAVFPALLGLLWHSFAVNTGIPGTVWGDYASSPLPTITMFTLGCATVYLGLILAAISDACSRNHPKWSTVIAVALIFIGVGVGFGYWALIEVPTTTVLAVALPLLVLSVPGFIGARHLAVVCERRWAQAEYRKNVQRRLPPPEVTSILWPNERVLIDMNNRTRTNPQPSHHLQHSQNQPQCEYLMATTRRFLHIAVGTDGRPTVIDEADPGQLLGGESRSEQDTVATLVHFRNRTDMQMRGGSAPESQQFSAALTFLAQHGSLRMP